MEPYRFWDYSLHFLGGLRDVIGYMIIRLTICGSFLISDPLKQPYMV